MDDPLPDLVLADTLWDFFRQEEYASQAAFEAAVHRYHLELQEGSPEIVPEEHWQPRAVVLRVPCVIIEFEAEATDGAADVCEVTLTSNDGRSFTAGELLFKLHNAAVARLRNNHHRWFEGFELSAITEDNVPVFALRLGS
jgi:hypothetical protein